MALSPDVRWCSKVVEMKGFNGPESEIFFSEKISSGKFSPELDELPTLRFWVKSLLYRGYKVIYPPLKNQCNFHIEIRGFSGWSKTGLISMDLNFNLRAKRVLAKK